MNLPSVTRADWAERITARWQTSLTAIFETGRLIAAAKADLAHGEFRTMIDSDLPFGARTAQMLMKVSDDPRLTNANHGSHLPVSWRTLFELTKLDDETFDAKIADGTIRPDMERRDLAQVVKRQRRETREGDLGQAIAALPDKRYGVILADPEWRFEPRSRVTGMDRAADNHYPTSTTQEIMARPVDEIFAADDCVLLLWATAPMLPDALKVMEAWGFRYVSHVVWLKDRIGTGYWFRNQHELLLVGTRGNIPAPAMGTQMRSALAFDVGAHSEKPPFAHEIAEMYFPNLPKIELNARTRRKGWDAWGNEAPPHDPDTGEIIEHQPGDAGISAPFAASAQAAGSAGTPLERGVGRLSRTEPGAEGATGAGDGGPAASAASPAPEPWPELPEFLRRTA